MERWGPLDASQKTLLLCLEIEKRPKIGRGQGVLVGIGTGCLWDGAMDDSVVSRMKRPLNWGGTKFS